MRHLIIPAVIILMLSSMIFFNEKGLRSTTGNLREIVDKAVTSIDNDDYLGASNALNEFMEKFDKYEPYLNTIIEHTILDEISIMVKRLKAYCSADGKTLFLAESGALWQKLQHMHEKEIFTLGTLL